MFALAWAVACVVVGARTNAVSRCPQDIAAYRLECELLGTSPQCWSDGGLVFDQVSWVSAGGVGIFAQEHGQGWCRCEWGHLDLRNYCSRSTSDCAEGRVMGRCFGFGMSCLLGALWNWRFAVANSGLRLLASPRLRAMLMRT